MSNESLRAPTCFGPITTGTLRGQTRLYELIDNSLDANAQDVVVRFESSPPAHRTVVSDNGSGCEDLALMFKYGGRKQLSETVMGRYGVGAKVAFTCFGVAPKSLVCVLAFPGW